MPDIIPGARPTRMELLALRKRRNIAQRGQDLLREKLDALMIEFFQFAREITALRAKTQDLLNQTYLRFAEAQMLMGATPLEGYRYSMIGTSAKLDEAVALMTEAVKNVVELSAAEAAIRRLAEAIAATKRRVNSLEYIVIPRILNTIRYIEMSLQERAREDFFRLKRIKTRLEEEKEEELIAMPAVS